jgi:hypothetical protein
MSEIGEVFRLFHDGNGAHLPRLRQRDEWKGIQSSDSRLKRLFVLHGFTLSLSC